MTNVYRVQKMSREVLASFVYGPEFREMRVLQSALARQKWYLDALAARFMQLQIQASCLASRRVWRPAYEDKLADLCSLITPSSMAA